MKDLEDLLDKIANNQVPPENLEDVFDRIAVMLLQKTKIVAGKSAYLLKEIEFYFSSNHYNHLDNYVHSNQYNIKRQGKFGEWYFHRYNSADTYDNDNHKRRGVDLTFGKEELCNFGGILIREIQNVETAQIISGTSKIVGEFIKEIGRKNLRELAEEAKHFAFNENSPLHLEADDNSLDKPIYKSPRILLSSGKKAKTSFYFKLYRYFNNTIIKQVQP